MTATGWTHDAIRDMSLGDVLGLLAYWSDTPPAHVILAARYLDRKGPRRGGFAPERRPEPNEADIGQLGALMGPVQPMKPYVKDLLDRAAAMLK